MVDNFLVSHGALCRVVCSRCLIRLPWIQFSAPH